MASQNHLKALSDMLVEAFDPDVPTRAAALRGLTQMVQNRSSEAVQAQEEVLSVSLHHPTYEEHVLLTLTQDL